MKTLLFTIILLATTFNSFPNEKDYVVIDGKKIECISVTTERYYGAIWVVEYTDLEGNTSKIEGIKKCLVVDSYKTDGEVYDLIPIKPSKPKKGKRHIWKKIDGKISVYHYTSSMTTSTATTTILLYTVKLDDKFYKINKKNLKKYIIPYLEKCDEFKRNYKKEYSHKQEKFEEMIKLYNEVCN